MQEDPGRVHVLRLIILGESYSRRWYTELLCAKILCLVLQD
jgi:hypothetical protein